MIIYLFSVTYLDSVQDLAKMNKAYLNIIACVLWFTFSFPSPAA